MNKKLLVGLIALGITAAFGAKNTFKINLLQDSIVNGKTVKAGTYKVAMENDKAVMTMRKESIEFPAHEVTTPNKFESNELTYRDNTTLEAISIGGTHTRIVIGGTTSHSGE